MEAVTCISCEAEIIIRNTVNIGSQVKCAHCAAELEVVWLDPLEVDWPFDDDDYDEEEEEEEFYYSDDD